MYLQHFGLKYPPLGKEIPELWDDGPLAQLKQRFQWLLDNPGVGLLTGEPGVGKTAALRLCMCRSKTAVICRCSVLDRDFQFILSDLFEAHVAACEAVRI